MYIKMLSYIRIVVIMRFHKNILIYILANCATISTLQGSIMIFMRWVLKGSQENTNLYLDRSQPGGTGLKVGALKEPSPIFQLFSNFWRFWYHKNAHIFLITCVKSYS